MKSQPKRYRYTSSTQLPWTTRFQSERKEKKLNIIPPSTRYANKGNTELSVRDRLYKKERGKRRTLESLLMQNIQDWLVRAV